MKSPDEILAEVEEAEADRIFTRARHRNRRVVADLRRELREANEYADQLERDIETLEALRSKPRPVATLEPAKRKRGGKLPAAFVALASDWHTCEIVNPAKTLGKNEHNQEIGVERAWRWARGIVTMCKREQETCDVKSLVLWLGGDFMVNDSLHYKSERSVDLSPPDEARFMRDLLAQIIAYIRAELDVPRLVILTSWGNHDRTSLKVIPGLGAEYSYMQWVYRDLASWFAKTPGVEFRIAESEWSVADIHGYRVGFHHGHFIKYGGGVGGLGIPLLKKVRIAAREHNVRTVCVGHFHTRGTYEAGLAFSNGSLVGTSAFSSDMMFQSEPPAQVAFVIDLERQDISNVYAIWGT